MPPTLLDLIQNRRWTAAQTLLDRNATEHREDVEDPRARSSMYQALYHSDPFNHDFLPIHVLAELSAPPPLFLSMLSLAFEFFPLKPHLLSITDASNRLPLHLSIMSAVNPSFLLETLRLITREYPQALALPCHFISGTFLPHSLAQLLASVNKTLLPLATTLTQANLAYPDLSALAKVVGFTAAQRATYALRVTFLLCLKHVRHHHALDSTYISRTLRLKNSKLGNRTSPLPLHPRTLFDYYQQNADMFSVILSYVDAKA